MPSKKPGHEVGRESALVAFGGKALLPFLDGHHGPGKPIDLIGDDGEVLFPHVPRHQRLELLGWYLPDVGGSTLHEHIGEVVSGIQAIQLGGLYEAVHQGAGPRAIETAVGDPILGSQFYYLALSLASKYEISHFEAYAQSWKMRRKPATLQKRTTFL